jgi:hypothetical protein
MNLAMINSPRIGVVSTAGYYQYLVQCGLARELFPAPDFLITGNPNLSGPDRGSAIALDDFF